MYAVGQFVDLCAWCPVDLLTG